MKRRNALRLLAGAWAGVSLGACRKPKAAPSSTIRRDGSVDVVLPEHGAYTGAFIDFGDAEDEVTIEMIDEFSDMVGKHQAIIASSSYWGEQNFPTANLNVVWRYGAMPLVFWSPWDKPYVQNRGPDKFSLTNILNHQWDSYIDKWAEAARDFGKPMIVSFANEMNGDWFPWSGCYYGGDNWIDLEDDANPEAGEWEGPYQYKRAYWYVVDRVRARGASNVKWVFHANNYSYPLDTWNFAPAYYPGKNYADWFGLSVYGQQFKDEALPSVESLADWPYEEMCRLDADTPVMIAEWATAEFPNSGNKAGWIGDALNLFLTRYPRVKAAVYWHERWQNQDQSYSNLRVNSSVESLQAYREGVANPDWIGELIFRPK